MQEGRKRVWTLGLWHVPTRCRDYCKTNPGNSLHRWVWRIGWNGPSPWRIKALVTPHLVCLGKPACKKFSCWDNIYGFPWSLTSADTCAAICPGNSSGGLPCPVRSSVILGASSLSKQDNFCLPFWIECRNNVRSRCGKLRSWIRPFRKYFNVSP